MVERVRLIVCILLLAACANAQSTEKFPETKPKYAVYVIIGFALATMIGLTYLFHKITGKVGDPDQEPHDLNEERGCFAKWTYFDDALPYALKKNKRTFADVDRMTQDFNAKGACENFGLFGMIDYYNEPGMFQYAIELGSRFWILITCFAMAEASFQSTSTSTTTNCYNGSCTTYTSTSTTKSSVDMGGVAYAVIGIIVFNIYAAIRDMTNGRNVVRSDNILAAITHPVYRNIVLNSAKHGDVKIGLFAIMQKMDDKMGCWDKRLFKWVIMKNNWFRICVVDVTSCVVSMIIIATQKPTSTQLLSAIFNFMQSIFNVYSLYFGVQVLAIRYILRCCKSAQEQVLDDASQRIEELVSENARSGGDNIEAGFGANINGATGREPQQAAQAGQAGPQPMMMMMMMAPGGATYMAPAGSGYAAPSHVQMQPAGSVYAAPSHVQMQPMSQLPGMTFHEMPAHAQFAQAQYAAPRQ